MALYQGVIRDASRGMGRGDLKVVVEAYTTTTSSYQPGGDPVTLTQVKEVKFAAVEASGGYVAHATSISGAAFKVQLYYLPDPTTYSGSTSTLTEVASGTNISGTVYNIFVVGTV